MYNPHIHGRHQHHHEHHSNSTSTQHPRASTSLGTRPRPRTSATSTSGARKREQDTSAGSTGELHGTPTHSSATRHAAPSAGEVGTSSKSTRLLVLPLGVSGRGGAAGPAPVLGIAVLPAPAGVVTGGAVGATPPAPPLSSMATSDQRAPAKSAAPTPAVVGENVQRRLLTGTCFQGGGGGTGRGVMPMPNGTRDTSRATSTHTHTSRFVLGTTQARAFTATAFARALAHAQTHAASPRGQTQVPMSTHMPHAHAYMAEWPAHARTRNPLQTRQRVFAKTPPPPKRAVRGAESGQSGPHARKISKIFRKQCFLAASARRIASRAWSSAIIGHG
jgi:hypothetical protein